MNSAEITAQVARYHWYHVIPLPDGTSTPGIEGFTAVLRWALERMDRRDLKDKQVLDVGARDCLAALRAEANGATVDAIDHDCSPGAKNFLLPLFNSKINYFALSLYDLNPAVKQYDVILFFGVLYHLRYPFRALRTLVDSLKVGGEILMEGGFLYDQSLQGRPLLYCPTDDSPYEGSSCSFFNPLAFDKTMGSFGCEKTEGMDWYPGDGSGLVRRGFAAYRKTINRHYPYWEPGGHHRLHTEARHAPTDWQPVDQPA